MDSGRGAPNGEVDGYSSDDVRDEEDNEDQAVAGAQGTVRCEACGLFFASRYSVVRHLRRGTCQKPTITCARCPYSTASKYRFELHMPHHGAGFFECDFSANDRDTIRYEHRPLQG